MRKEVPDSKRTDIVDFATQNPRARLSSIMAGAQVSTIGSATMLLFNT